LNGKGRVLSELKRYDEAITCYDRSIELDPDNQATKKLKAIALNGKGRRLYESDAEAYRRKIKISKFIVLAAIGALAITLGIALFVPFPYVVPIIVAPIILWGRWLYNYMNRNSRKCLQIAKGLELSCYCMHNQAPKDKALSIYCMA
jgi:tetratricopeptide (TPR) repeat protein